MMSFDVIVIGGGHNGLVAATLLAKTGRKVALYEANETLGGAAQTVEFHPGFKVSHIAHVLNRLHRDVIKALDLTRYGLKLGSSSSMVSVLDAGGRPLTLSGAYGETIEGDISDTEKAAWQTLRAQLFKHAGILKQVFDHAPPPFEGARWSELFRLGKTALSLRLLGKVEMRHFLRMILICIDDVANDQLSDDRLKGLLAIDATMGVHLGPRSPTSLLGLYYRLAGDLNGSVGIHDLPVGGMGAVIGAMEKSALAAGVVIHRKAPIARITSEAGQVTGVELSDGSNVNARVVFSGVDAKTTFLKLTGPRVLDTGFVRAISHIRMKGDAVKLHLALDQLPAFKGLSATALAGRMVIAPSSNFVEHAFNPSKYGELPDQPSMEITVPSVGDPSLAPSGKAVLSVIIQHAPFELKMGWDKGRDLLLKNSMKLLENYAPGIGRSVIASELLTPVDIERLYNMTGGHWHHGELQADQMAMMRPVHAASRYTTPIKGLYLCGASSHPGGGISGQPALNSVRSFLKRA